MFRKCLSLLLALVVGSTLAFGIGGDHKSGDLPPQDGWPMGLYEVVNAPNRVHGYWVNSSDVLFYRGNSQDLHPMLDGLADVPDAKVEVVLHPGNAPAKSPWSQKSFEPADWSITIAGDRAVTTTQDQVKVDIWLGGGVDLASLRIPASLRVKSGGEIDGFIDEHNSRRKND